MYASPVAAARSRMYSTVSLPPMTTLDDGYAVDPFDDTVTVYRPGHEPVLFNRTQELVGDPELPGFRCRVAEIFE